MSDVDTIATLPASQSDERGLLGVILHEPNVLLWAKEYISPSEFQSPMNGRLFLIACDLFDHGDKIDSRTIIAALGANATQPVFPGFTLQEYIGHLFMSVDLVGKDPDQYGEDFAREVARLSELRDESDLAPDERSAAPEQTTEIIDPKRKVRFALKKFSDVKLTSRARFLVRNIIPLVGITVIWGPPKCGKSFWLFDLLMHVALGWSYRSLKVQQGIVVYLVLEGDTGFSDRLLAFKQHFLANHKGDVPFYVLATRLDLVADTAELIRDLKSQLAPGAKVAAIAIDTLNRSLRGSENNDQDMGNYIKAADLIKETFDCAVPIIHHSGVGGERPRGHTSLTGAVDSQISVKRNETRQILSTVEYLKDGAEGHQCVSSLKVIDIGREETGEAITSCIVETIDRAASKTGYKLTDSQFIFMETIFEALAQHGVSTVDAGLAGKLPKSVQKVVDYKFVRDVFNAKTPQNDQDDQAHDDRIRQALSRASREMRKVKAVGYIKPFMWFTGKALQGFSTTNIAPDDEEPLGYSGPPDDDPRFL